MCHTSACDAQPSGEQGPDFSVPCHTEMQPRRGIWNLENVDTKSLGDKKIMEGAFGLMRQRLASINDLPNEESDRKYHWRLGRRPDPHPGLTDLGL